MRRSLTIILVIILSLLGCSRSNSDLEENENPVDNDGKINITIMLHSQSLADEYQESADLYMAEHPDVRIHWKIYDNESYKSQLIIRAAINDLTDIYGLWTNPSEFLPYIKGGQAMELPREVFDQYNYVPDILDACSYDGKLYGLPRTISYRFIFYNRALFDAYGLKVPATISELEHAIEVFNQNSIIPMAMHGQALWAQMVLFHEIIMRLNNDDASIFTKAVSGEMSFAETPVFTEASDLMKQLIDQGFFQENWEDCDYSKAEALFVSGKAAMFPAGSWMFQSLLFSEDADPEIRDNIGYMTFPAKNNSTMSKSIIGFSGMCWSISAYSPHKDVALDILTEWMKPENSEKRAFQREFSASPQRFSDALTGKNMHPLIRDFNDYTNNIEHLSGQPFAWLLTPIFEIEAKKNSMEFFTGRIDSGELWTRMDMSAAKNQL